MLKFLVVVFLLIGVWSVNSLSRNLRKGEAQQDYTFSGNWQPNQSVPGNRYVGSEACAQCHTSQSKEQHNSAMGKALMLPAETSSLRAREKMEYRSGRFNYRISREGSQSFYTVTDGTQTVREPILYAAGQGRAGQTYLLKHGGDFYESRISFYNELNNLDLTFGYETMPAHTIEEALGNQKTTAEMMACMRCHATTAKGTTDLSLEKFEPGVRCESCHGPGEKHIAAMKLGSAGSKFILNPKTLNGDQLSQEFCGFCHRGVEQVMAFDTKHDISSVRFQPYQLYKSRCYSEDRRIGCTACHNPHEPLKTEPTYYDAKCTACHQVLTESQKKDFKAPAATDKSATDKPVLNKQSTAIPSPHPPNTRGCVTCHMPKVDVQGSHFKFTDHYIQVVKAG